MSVIHGVAVATISKIADPMAQGRVLIVLPEVTGSTPVWAQVVRALSPGGPLKINDKVLVAFGNGDPARPYVIGMLSQGSSPPLAEEASMRTVRLPAGGAFHPIAGGAGEDGSSVCATTADLQRQVAPWLASTECLLRMLALLKPLIDIVQTVPSGSPASRQQFAKAAAALQPCLLMNTPASALPLVKDLLCLTLQSLTCLQSLPSTDQARAAVGIQGVLDLGSIFFGIAGVPPVRLSVLSNPAGLAADISAVQTAVDALGGCV